jgi:type 1 glutamine amidotransferase
MQCRFLHAALVPLLLALAVSDTRAADASRADPPVEQQPRNKKAAKVVLIAGSNFYKSGEHEYVGSCSVLMDLLRQTSGVEPVLAIDWPKKPETLKGAKAIVFFFDGGDKHAVLRGERAAELQKLVAEGVGLVQLHQAVDYPKDRGEAARAWAGACWEQGYSARAHWVAEFKTFPDHPVFRGVKPFTVNDGWLTKLRFAEGMKGVTPLLRTSPPDARTRPAGSEDVVAWAFERPGGGRSFSFTGGHLHSSFAREGYRRFLVNGILWSAGMEVPPGGAKVDLDPDKLPTYLKKPPKP